ncbi:MAG: chromate transporter [Candidatus Syntrophonatronum acetioxidans]|uniref:Chromate transporter n=1 Tax=Candidatus Syntrophonatronum acetioxidans TaxID=1795816 RepID=A0A424YHB2_9FIRM|nr:MAG: chromate transporter [Candidatus Syntrophonatronum acetioxidans]
MILTIFFIFLKIGAFTFGGGLAMLPIVKKELEEKRGWVSSEEFLDVVAVSMTVPGAIVINTASNIGYRIKGIPGSLAAVAGASLPSFMVILAIAMFFIELQDYPPVQAVLQGIRPAVAALIAAAIFKIGKPIVTNLKSFVFVILFLALSLALDLHPILIIIMGALTGLVFYRKPMDDSKDE